MGGALDYFKDKIHSGVKHPSTAEASNNSGPILPISNPSVASTVSNQHLDGIVSPSAQADEKNASHFNDHVVLHKTSPEHGHITSATGNNTPDASIAVHPPPAPPPINKSEVEGSGDPAIAGEQTVVKKPIGKRMLDGSKRFCNHVKNAVTASYVNVLLIFVPIGIAAEAAKLNPAVIFALNAVAIVPLAGLLAHATEAVASRLGNNIGALLNVTFGNAVELIIFIIALAKNEIRIVQASLIGSILANLLLILGMAFLLGGLRFQEQIYNNVVTQTSAVLLTLSVGSLVLPTAFHASFNQGSSGEANTKILEVSRGTSVILLLIYGLYLLFQLKSHAYMYAGTPQEKIDEESHPGLLADMLNSSSSSSSDTDDSSSSDSSGSHGTAGKRFKRLLKNRRRRKSSASTSTAGTVSMPSMSSPSTEARENYFEGRSQQTSRRASPLGIIVSGDEADADAEDNHATRVRDFVSLDSDAFRSHRKRRHRRKHKRHHKRRQPQEEVKAGAEANPEETTQHHVEFANLPEEQTVEPTPEQAVPKRPFIVRGLSTRATTLRPGLTKMLSNNVFNNPPQQQQANPVRRVRDSGLRRTTSLPDRLNKQQEPEGQFRVATLGNLPPYTVRRIPTPRANLAGEVNPEELAEADDKPEMSRTAAVVMLLVTTALTAVCAEFMVDAIPQMISNSPVSEAFVGLIILPIVGNAAEHVTAVTVAAKNKMDLAIGVAVGSSIQIALFVTPIIVLLGWIMNTEMSLYFNIFETVAIFITVLVVNFLCLDGRSNYLEGALLIAAYVIIALVAFYYPATDSQSSMGGGYIS